ncbi:MAG: hypothetical protein U1F43_06960 [Myxococcota bacterium]
MTAGRTLAAAAAVSGALACAGGRAQAFDPHEDRAVRVLVESGAGIGGGAIGGFSGGGLSYLICAAAGEDRGMFGCLGPALIGGVIGAWWGMAGGVALAGDGMGGNGGFGWELLGQAGGTAVAAGLFYGLSEVIDSEVFDWFTWIAFPLAGGILGYELSTHKTGVDARPVALTIPLSFRF